MLTHLKLGSLNCAWQGYAWESGIVPDQLKLEGLDCVGQLKLNLGSLELC